MYAIRSYYGEEYERQLDSGTADLQNIGGHERLALAASGDLALLARDLV